MRFTLLPNAIYLLLSISITSYAQSNNKTQDTNNIINNITIKIMDSNVVKLLEKKDDLDKKTKLQGYRIQIFSGPSRINVYSTQAKFAIHYPNVNNYITYDGSNYKLRVGDFIFYKNAENFRKEIYNKFNIALIIKDTINKHITTDNNTEEAPELPANTEHNEDNNILIP